MSDSLKIWGQVLVVYATGLGAAGQFAKIAIGFAALETVYPEAGAQLGLIVSVLSFLGVAFGLVGGMIVARLGVRRVLVWGLALGAALSAHQALLPSLPVFLVSRLIEGSAHLAIVIAAPTLIAEITRDAQRPVAMALWSTFFGAGFALFAWLGAPQVVQHGPSVLMWAHAIWMLLCAGMTAWMVPRLPQPDIPERLTQRLVLQRHVTVYGSASMAAPALGWLFYTMTFLSILTLLPRLSDDAERLATVLPLVSIVVSMTLIAAILRKVAAVPVVSVGFGLSALMIPVIALSPQNAWLWVMLFAILAAIQAGSFAAIPQLCHTPLERALANGAVAQMGNLGNLAGTPLLLMVLTGADLAGGLIFLALCYAGGLATHVILAQSRLRTSR